MTQETANSVKPLASSCYEAIQAIAGERECPKCEGLGLLIRYGSQEGVRQIRCSNCNGTGKVGWKWEPTIGDKVCRSEMILFYAGIIPAIDGKRAGKFISDAGTEYEWPIDIVTPILPWETIEEILEGVGYELEIETTVNSLTKKKGFYVKLWNPKAEGMQGVDINAKTCQEAVMQSIIALGKGIRSEKM